MKYRKGVFLVVYREERGKLKYLLLHRKLHWKGWEFPKAGVKGKEKLENTARRELKEETGFKPLNIKKFNVSGKYKYGKEIKERETFLGQTYMLFAAEVGRGKVKLDKKEHDKYKWVEFKRALKMLTWPNQRKCLKVVERLLKR